LDLRRRRKEHDYNRLRMASTHLLGALEVDLQEDVETRRRGRPRRPIGLPQELSPLEECTIADEVVEGMPVDEDVRALVLPRTARAGRVRAAEPEPGLALYNAIRNSPLSGPTRSE
jgi:hypothetical protein